MAGMPEDKLMDGREGGNIIMMDYFGFRIIEMETGDQIIDRNVKMPYSALTALQMEEYMEVDARLYFMDREERKAKIEAERKRKLARNPIYKMACLCGLV